MTVVPFPPRLTTAARTLDELFARKRSPQPYCDITLRKDSRERRYAIWSNSPGHFVGEVWFGRCPHRKKRVAGLHAARMLACQFAREILDLVSDGWTEDT
jgi:hypothetical protein